MICSSNKMVHDILLALLSLENCDSELYKSFNLKQAKAHLHGCEEAVLLDIMTIVDKLQHIIKFFESASDSCCLLPLKLNTSSATTSDAVSINSEGNTSILSGRNHSRLYVEGIAVGVRHVLEFFFNQIREMERQFLRNPKESLMYLSNKIEHLRPPIHTIYDIVMSMQMQEIYDCAIVKHVERHFHHGNPIVRNTIKTLLKPVQKVFLKDLINWLLYARTDLNNEFFIRAKKIDSDDERDSRATPDSEKILQTLWKYDVHYESLPQRLDCRWADQVYFIGQLVLLFRDDSIKLIKKKPNITERMRLIIEGKFSIWEEKEDVFHRKIIDLHEDGLLNRTRCENVISEMKSYASSCVYDIALEHGELMAQIKLIKDFYLMGRGELFLEFIHNFYFIDRRQISETNCRSMIKSFKHAMYFMDSLEDLDRVSIRVNKDKGHVEDGDIIDYIELDCKIEWPLHLIFPPETPQRYNIIFRFLLRLKVVQFKMQKVWILNTHLAKNQRALAAEILTLRNNFSFFIDNLLYYIQVDVLESQLKLLCDFVETTKDIEEIKMRHSIFLTNLYGLCFMLSEYEEPKDWKLPTANNETGTSWVPTTSPVYATITDIMYLAEEFCDLLELDDNQVKLNNEMPELKERYFGMVESLIAMLSKLKSPLTSTPLAQFLVRLDFNYWFSAKRILDEIDETAEN